MGKSIALSSVGENSFFKSQIWKPTDLKRGEPVESAKEFCNQRVRPLVYWRGDFYEWCGTHYRTRSTDTVVTEIYSFLSVAQVNVEIKTPEGSEWRKLPFGP